MSCRSKMILVSLCILSAAGNASAQSGRVSLKPVLKPDREYRYRIQATVDTRVNPTGANGIASTVRRETIATVRLSAVASEKGDVTNEAIIESVESRTTVDGIDRPATGSSLAGLKLQYHLDGMGRLTKASIPKTVVETGLADLIFSLTRWVPATDVAVGQTWGDGLSSESLVGDYGYFTAPSISDISRATTISYRLSKLDGDKAIVEGAIALNKNGDSLLTTMQGALNVNVIVAGKGSAQIEYDIAASRIVAATTETSTEGRLAITPPGPKDEKRQPREGSVVEKSTFTIKLVE